MVAFVVLALAILSRILPHAFGAVGWNFTALGAGLLFFGSQLVEGKTPAKTAGIKLAVALAALAVTDWYLTVFVYGYSFHVSGYAVTWCWYALACVLGMALLSRPSAVRVVAAVFASATSFFVLSNFAVWAGGQMYPRTAAGLGACYVAAIPFYRNDLVSTALTAGVLFGVPALVRRLADTPAAPATHV